MRLQKLSLFWRKKHMTTFLILLVLTIIVGFPIYWMIVTSFRPEGIAQRYPPELIPSSLTLDNYKNVFNRMDLMVGRWLLNSLLVATLYTLLTLLVTSLAAYGFARLRFPGQNFLFLMVLFGLMVPGQVTLIPVFMTLRDLKWLDTYQALIIPACASIFGLFLLRQFFKNVPIELEEAAIIDGASRFRIYWQIILPTCTNALVALAIFTFLASWNDLYWPLIVMNRLEMRTLPVGLTVLQGTYSREVTLVLAGAAVASIPVLIFYAIFQKRIIEGTALTGFGGR